MDTIEKFAVGVVATLMLAVTALIGLLCYTEYMQLEVKRQVVIEVTRQFREIPVCDKPIWDRITDGCGEDE